MCTVTALRFPAQSSVGSEMKDFRQYALVLCVQKNCCSRVTRQGTGERWQKHAMHALRITFWFTVASVFWPPTFGYPAPRRADAHRLESRSIVYDCHMFCLQGACSQGPLVQTGHCFCFNVLLEFLSVDLMFSGLTKARDCALPPKFVRTFWASGPDSMRA